MVHTVYTAWLDVKRRRARDEALRRAEALRVRDFEDGTGAAALRELMANMTRAAAVFAQG